MSSWIAQHFLNAGLFWPAVGLIAAPILIHLINRLRYRRVRFAAMEFLLNSEQRNRRRVFIEHLLLLLARVAIVALIGMLIARFVADPRQLSMFQGAKAHHILLIDDSGSMRERQAERTAFDAAREIVRKLAAEGAQRPETQLLTVLRMSRPSDSLGGLSERSVDDALVAELSTRLEDMSCTYGSVDVAAALETLRARLADDAASVKQLHIVSDFRRDDWHDNKASATAIKALSQLDVGINLIRTVEVGSENLAVTELTGETSSAAAGVPVTFTTTLENTGTRDADGVRLAVQVDGAPLPVNLVIDKVPAGGTMQRELEIIFDKSGTHRIVVSLESDALEADNARRLAIVVPDSNPVLIIDGSPGAEKEQGRYIADALAANQLVTGYATTLELPDYLRRHPLDGYQLIEIANVADLPEDAVDVLEKYVAAGGGLAWFVGDQVRPSFYNDRLYKEGQGLFPTRLGNGPQVMTRPENSNSPEIVAGDNPLFLILAGTDNPFINEVFVNVFYPVDREQFVKDRDRTNGIKELAGLRNKSPLMIEHRFGLGRVVTCLTSAGPLLTPEGESWTNWANGPGAPSYAVMQLELARLIARGDRMPPPKMVGDPIVIPLDRTKYRETVEVVGPDDQVSQVTAIDDAKKDEPPVENSKDAPAELPLLTATYEDTIQPGFYTTTLLTQSQQPEQEVLAFNVPEHESRLAVADDNEIRKSIGDDVEVSIQPAGTFEWIRSESPGRELRWIILALLAGLFLIEQVLAYRLSYQTAGDRPITTGRRGALAAR
jgi:hypothetical protein